MGWFFSLLVTNLGWRLWRADGPKHSLPYCSCGYLERAAAQPHSPIRYNREFAEFQFASGPNKSVGAGPIYHCPICAGRAPTTLQADADAVAGVTESEISRLSAMTAGLLTEQDVRAKLGEPTRVHELVVPSNVADSSAPHAKRTLIYEQHSTVAAITAEIDSYNRAAVSFLPKTLSATLYPTPAAA